MIIDSFKLGHQETQIEIEHINNLINKILLTLHFLMSDLKLLTSSHKTNIACLKCLVLHSESFLVTT